MNVRPAFTRPVGLAASATLAIGFVAAAPAAAAIAGAPSASASVHDGTLTIEGSNQPDAITIGVSADPSKLSVDLGAGDAPLSVDRATFTSISVFLGNGDDSFSVSPTGQFSNAHLTVSGGNGNDMIRGSDGNDLLFGDNGDDNIDGGRGADTEILGNGDDTALWLPGEASDVVDGGLGHDVLTFIGAAGNEKFALAAHDNHVILTRDPGTVRMDLVAVEHVDLSALGGVDTVGIGDLRGTDLETTDVDLTSGGGSDGQLDTVTIAGTDQADNVAVAATGNAVDVTGLRTVTHISGADTRDQLQVATGDGNDAVSVADAARALITVAVDLGAGQL